MQGVASHLTQVGAEDWAAVMVDHCTRFIPQCVTHALDVGAQQGVLAGPEVFTETAHRFKNRTSHKEITTRKIFDAAQGALNEITASEVARD